MSKYGYYLGMTPEQQDIVKMIREFAERELDPVVKEYDEKGEFPVQLHEKWGEMGLFGLDVPEQYGGLGLNAVTRYCISEELAKHDAYFTISNNSYSFGLSAILADGTEAQKQAACARILRGEGISMAITEPQSGSDVGSTRTSAKKVDGGYVLNGVKCFITNATLCSACVVLAVTNPDAGYHGMSLLLVEKKRRRGERRQARGQDGHPPVGHGGFRDGGRVRPRRPPDRHGGQRLCPDHEIPRRANARSAWRAPSAWRSARWIWPWTTPGSAASSTGRSQNSRAFSS